MGLRDEIAAHTQRCGRKSTFDTVIAVLSPEDAADLRAALADPTVPATRIWRALRARGFELCATTVRNWRYDGRDQT